MMLSLAACGNNNNTDPSNAGSDSDAQHYTVGICQYVQHPALDQATEGFKAALTDMLGEGNVEFTEQNANGDSPTCATIINGFVSSNVDLILANATAPLQAAAAGTDTIPVIGTSVTDYATALAIDDWTGTTGRNITGTSDALPVEGQLQLIRALQPDADTIGIVYTTSEANSVYSIGVYEELAADYGFTIEAIGVTAQSEVTQAVDTLISQGVDCLSNLTDNNVVGVLGSILEKTNEAGIPVYGSEIEQMELGCVAGAGLDYVQLGIQTGKMAAQILTGEATCEDLPYETIENYGLYVNSNALAAMGLTLPEDVAQNAEEVGETA